MIQFDTYMHMPNKFCTKEIETKEIEIQDFKDKNTRCCCNDYQNNLPIQIENKQKEAEEII